MFFSRSRILALGSSAVLARPPQPHQLIRRDLRGAKQPGNGWTCDGKLGAALTRPCRHHGNGNAGRYRCTQGCDWDLCQACFDAEAGFDNDEDLTVSESDLGEESADEERPPVGRRSRGPRSRGGGQPRQAKEIEMLVTRTGLG